MKNEIQKIETKNSLSAENLIDKALDNKVDVATIERLLAMRKELKAEFAKEQFDEAMAKFQGKCPVIEKSVAGGETKAGVVAYKYAPLDVIVNQTKELIGECGFSYATKIETNEKSVKAICIVKHISGHSESSEMDVPHGTKTGIMSESQKFAATSTFAKRYAFCNAFGIMTGDEDTDAKKEKAENEIKEEANKFIENLKECKTVESLALIWESIPATFKINKEVKLIKDKLKIEFSKVEEVLESEVV